MGCIMSCRSRKKRGRNGKRMVYSVKNINDKGKILFCGKIEIVDGKLILRGKRDKKGDSSVVWPLTTVRRYGYEQGMFCIETGHGSPTGDGVFAFYCKRAKCFFDDVQNTLKTDDVNNSLLNDNENECDASQSNDSTDKTNTDSFNDYLTLRAPSEPLSAEYHAVTYAGLRDSSTDKTDSLAESFSDYLTLRAPSEPLSAEYHAVTYAGLRDSSTDKTDSLAESFSDYLTLRAPLEPLPVEDHVTYTELEFVPSSKCPLKMFGRPAKPPAEEARGGYTIIDFERTMHVSQKMFRRNDNSGVRKTRHDSVDP